MLNLKLAKKKMENEQGMNHLLIKVKPEKSERKVEKPVAFVLVMDVSGSMSELVGEQHSHQNQFFSRISTRGIENKREGNTKLSYVKQASEYLVDMMKDGDMLGVVSFSDTASLEYPLTKLNRDVRFQLKDRIRALTVRGMTNMSDGLEMAMRQIPSELKNTHHIKFILLSDGHANYGITNADRMGTLVQGYRQEDVSVSTIGVGNDYNSYFMEIIATTSGGMFYHLKEMTQLNAIFTSELETLTSLTTKQVSIKVELPDGVHMEENLNGFQEEQKGNVYIGNVFHEVPILMEIYTEDEIPLGKRAIKVSMSYTDVEGVQKTVEKTISLTLVLEEEMDNVETNQEVVALVKELLEAKTKKEAIRSYEDGNIQGASSSVQRSMTKMSRMFDSYDIEDEDDTLSNLEDFGFSLQKRSLTKADAKMMYSKSYNQTRNVKKEDEK